MSPSRDLADMRMVFRYSQCLQSVSVIIARSHMPRMPFMGVRISWLMFARNSLLAMLAASASRAIWWAYPMASSSSEVRSFTRNSSSSLMV